MWIDLPPGTFNQALPYENRCQTNRPVSTRRVTLTHGFAISKHEVTQQEFAATAGASPACTTEDESLCQGAYPALNVTWSDAAYYCNVLSAKSGFAECYSCSVSNSNTHTTTAYCTIRPEYEGTAIYTCPGYRLPTDAEWEYAYRAGSDTELYNGQLASCSDDDVNANAIAWYKNNSDKRPHVVEQKLPNAWGLFDMAGNAAEFVHDRQNLSLATPSPNPVTDPINEESGKGYCCLQVVRGGSYGDFASMVQASSRMGGFGTSNSVFPSNGFRPVRSKSH